VSEDEWKVEGGRQKAEDEDIVNREGARDAK